MTRLFQTTAAAVVFGAALATAIAAEAGQPVAAGSSLTEIAVDKLNAGTRRDDRQQIVQRDGGAADPAARRQLIAQAGLDAAEAADLALSDITAAKLNVATSRDERVVVVSSRGPVTGLSPARTQLIAQAGLDAEAARGMTLGEIYAAKINRDLGRDDRQY